MSSGAKQERRRLERSALVTFCPALFHHDGQERRALMRDLTAHGAGFRIEHSEDELTLHPGETLAYIIKTPYGESRCSIRTVWARHIDDHYSWGGEFVELSDDERDPLRALIDSPF
jgi:hypothetical protein